MALLDYIPSFIGSNYGVIGSVIGVLIFIAIVWYFIAKSRSGRTGIELEEIKEDKELYTIDKKILKTEKDEKYEAAKLYKLLMKVHKGANKLGFRINDRLPYLNAIVKGLNVLKTGNVNVTAEERLVKQINNYLNIYLNNFPGQDKKIIKWISQIREIQGRLYGDISVEIDELHQKEELLRKEYEQTKKEEAA